MRYGQALGRALEGVARGSFDRGYDLGRQAGRDEGKRMWLCLSIAFVVIYAGMGKWVISILWVLLAIGWTALLWGRIIPRGRPRLGELRVEGPDGTVVWDAQSEAWVPAQGVDR